MLYLFYQKDLWNNNLVIISLQRKIYLHCFSNSLRTKNSIIDLMSDQKSIINKGGTLRLGNYPCSLVKNTLAYNDYKKDMIYERHRHRYEFNNKYKELLEENGLVFSGRNVLSNLVEIIELPNHKHFIASQFHPEFKSRPTKAHPLFLSFIKASISK